MPYNINGVWTRTPDDPVPPIDAIRITDIRGNVVLYQRPLRPAVNFEDTPLAVRPLVDTRRTFDRIEAERIFGGVPEFGRITERTQREPLDLPIPKGYDVGNIRAICYAIDSGLSEKALFNFLGELKCTFVELESTIKIYSGTVMNLPLDRMTMVKKVFKDYTEQTELPARKTPCESCKKEYIYWNLMSIFAKPADREKSVEMKVCASCCKKLQKNVAICEKHFGAVLLGDVRPKCPLYPTKCKPVGYCTSAECLHKHMVFVHKGYNLRRWKTTKRLFSKTEGDIIKSDILSGVEFEVVGKNRQAMRTNIFKLGKVIGIDHDHSIDQFYLATEVVTPPASGRKLEDLINNVCVALLKDGFVVNNKCGLHVHIDLYRKFGHINVKPDFYKSLLAAYTIFEAQFYNLVPVERQRNVNIKTISDKFAGNLANKAYFDSTKFSKIWYRTGTDANVLRFRNEKRHETKYYWANFHSLLRNEGLEIRLMEGSIDARAILFWIRLQHEFIQKVAETPMMYKQFAELYNLANNQKQIDGDKFFLDFLKPDADLLEFIEERRMMKKASTRGAEMGENQITDIVEQLFRT